MNSSIYEGCEKAARVLYYRFYHSFSAPPESDDPRDAVLIEPLEDLIAKHTRAPEMHAALSWIVSEISQETTGENARFMLTMNHKEYDMITQALTGQKGKNE